MTFTPAPMSDRMQALMDPSIAWLKDANAKSDAQALETWSESKAVFVTAMRKLSEPQSQFSPGEGEWSAHQLARHMIHTHRGIGGLIQLLAAGNQLDAKGTPGEVPPGSESFATLCDELDSSFDQLAKSFESILGNDPETSSKFDHPYFGPFTAREWFIFCPLHVNIHLDQLKRITESEGFPSS